MKVGKQKLAILAIVAVAVSVIYYGRFLGNYFVYDDFKYLENMLDGPRAIVLGYGNLRVVANLAWWPLYLLSGADPFLYNLFAILIHAANAILLYLFLSRLPRLKDYALFGSALFLLNGVGCDALFWKAANSTLISLFFYLSALYLYVAYSQGGGRSRYLLSLGLALLAMFSKEDAASLPFIILLVEILFFEGGRRLKETAVRVAPYVAIVLIYFLANWIVFNLLQQTTFEHARLFKVRPLYSLLAGWTVFFLSPQGYLTMGNPAIYLTAVGIIASFFWVRDRRLLYFGYGWIFFVFLPQSFTSLGQFIPENTFRSISRYHYITSIGSSLILAAVICRLRELFSPKVCRTLTAVFFFLFIGLNYFQVQQRGMVWRGDGERLARFLGEMKRVMPAFPPDSHVFVVNAPTGRAYMQQSLRVVYGTRGITWIPDPAAYVRKPGENVFFIVCDWKDNGEVALRIKTPP